MTTPHVTDTSGATPLSDAHIERFVNRFGESCITDPAQLTPYSRDWSYVAPAVPALAILPASLEEAVELVALADELDLAITPRGTGTGKAGGAIPAPQGLVVSLERMNRIIDLDPVSMTVEVEAGVITAAIHNLVELQHLFYPPDPASLTTCTIGGNLATNASGPRGAKYGVTRDYVLGLTAVVAPGEPLFVGKRTLKGVAGLDLTSLFVGSEGTLGLITSAVLKLRVLPESRTAAMLYFTDENAACAFVAALAPHAIEPAAAELLDALSLTAARRDATLAIPPAAGAALLIELDGDQPSCDRQQARLAALATDHHALDLVVATDDTARNALWTLRRNLSNAVKHGFAHYISEDVCVSRRTLPALVAFIRHLAHKHPDFGFASYGHAGDGNLHVNILFHDEAEASRAKAISQTVFQFVIAHGGTITAEHGVGTAKRSMLSADLDPAAHALMLRVKRTLDPRNLFNPGKAL